jgi:signal transduction histidine kinase/ligand-binding sensor domain-containing protein
MWRRLCGLLVLLVLFLLGGSAKAGAPDTRLPSGLLEAPAPPLPVNPRFDSFNLDIFSAHFKVNCFFQDRQGFVWLAGSEGLYRYDGYEALHYPLPPVDGRTAGEPRYIMEDHAGIFWIAADDGLDRFDPLSGQWAFYRSRPNEPSSLAEGPVIGVLEDAQQQLWVGAGESLDLLDRQTGQFKHFSLNKDGSPGSRTITALAADRQGRLWATTQNGVLNRLNPASGGVQRYALNRPDAGNPATAEVGAMLVDPSDALWLAVKGGLLHFDPQQERFTWLPHGDAAYADDRPTALVRTPEGNFWVATAQAGLYHLDLPTARWSHMTLQIGDPYSLSEPGVESLLLDRAGILWLSNHSGQVNRFVPWRNWRIYRHARGNPNSLSSDDISAIAEDQAGRLWIGTHGAGLNRYDRTSGQWTQYLLDTRGTGGLNDNLVTALAIGTQGEIWVGTQFGGLNRLAPEQNRWDTFQNGSAADSFSGAAIQTLLAGSDGVVWVGAASGILDRLDARTGKFTHYHAPQPQADPNPLSSMISALAFGRPGELWVGTNGGALYRMTSANGQWSADWLASTWQGQPRSVTSLFADAKGALWVGTLQGGLIRLDLQTGALQRIQPDEAQPLGDVVSIQADEQGMLWLGTSSGLVRVDPAHATFEHFGIAEGLPGEGMSNRAALQLRSGEMIFGSASGLTIFDPRAIAKNPHVPPMVLSDVQLDYRSMNPERITAQPDGSREVRLSYLENRLTFSFAALDYTDPTRSQYAYRLEGVDPDWVPAGARRQAAYANLAPGEYRFRVKATNSDGVWNEQGATLHILIQPPFWQTAPFWVLVGLVVAGGLFGGVRWRLSTLERQKGQLETRVQERTRELNDALAELEKSKVAAEHAAVMEERQRLARELHDSVTQLIYSQVLSADIGRKLLRQGKLPALEKTLNELGGVAVQSLKEMRLLLYELRPSFFEQEGLRNALELRLDSVERRSHVDATLEIEGDPDQLPAQVSWELYRVMIEALNNALKHAQASEVRVRLSVRAVDGGPAQHVDVEVCDNGIGFDPQTTGAGGMGLGNMAERAAKIGAQLEISSSPGQGARVRVAAKVKPMNQEGEL